MTSPLHLLSEEGTKIKKKKKAQIQLKNIKNAFFACF
jgi:hypothetical protein